MPEKRHNQHQAMVKIAGLWPTELQCETIHVPYSKTSPCFYVSAV